MYKPKSVDCHMCRWLLDQITTIAIDLTERNNANVEDEVVGLLLFVGISKKYIWESGVWLHQRGKK